MSQISVRVQFSTDDDLYRALRAAAVSANEGGARLQERDVLSAVLRDPNVLAAALAAAESYGADPAETQARALEDEAAEIEARAQKKRAQAERLRNPPEPEGPEDLRAAELDEVS